MNDATATSERRSLLTDQQRVYQTLHIEMGHRAWSWMGFESAQGRCGDQRLGARTLSWHMWGNLLHRLTIDPVAALRVKGGVRLAKIRAAKDEALAQARAALESTGQDQGRRTRIVDAGEPEAQVPMDARAQAIADALDKARGEFGLDD